MNALPEEVDTAIKDATEEWPPEAVPYVRQIAFEMLQFDLPHDTIAEWITDLIRHASSARDLSWMGDGQAAQLLKKQLFPKQNLHGKTPAHAHCFVTPGPGQFCEEPTCMLTWEEYERRGHQ